MVNSITIANEDLPQSVRNILSAYVFFKSNNLHIQEGENSPKVLNNSFTTTVGIGWLMKNAPEVAAPIIAKYHASLLGVTP